MNEGLQMFANCELLGWIHEQSNLSLVEKVKQPFYSNSYATDPENRHDDNYKRVHTKTAKCYIKLNKDFQFEFILFIYRLQKILNNTNRYHWNLKNFYQFSYFFFLFSQWESNKYRNKNKAQDKDAPKRKKYQTRCH